MRHCLQEHKFAIFRLHLLLISQVLCDMRSERHFTSQTQATEVTSESAGEGDAMGSLQMRHQPCSGQSQVAKEKKAPQHSKVASLVALLVRSGVAFVLETHAAIATNPLLFHLVNQSRMLVQIVARFAHKVAASVVTRPPIVGVALHVNAQQLGRRESGRAVCACVRPLLVHVAHVQRETARRAENPTALGTSNLRMRRFFDWWRHRRDALAQVGGVNAQHVRRQSGLPFGHEIAMEAAKILIRVIVRMRARVLPPSVLSKERFAALGTRETFFVGVHLAHVALQRVPCLGCVSAVVFCACVSPKPQVRLRVSSQLLTRTESFVALRAVEAFGRRPETRNCHA